SARPTTTGESASGRSTTAFTSPLPGNRRRTIASASVTPKTVFAGTAISVIRTVSQKAWRASCVVTACQAGENPCSKVRQKTRPTGARRSTARYERPTKRSAYLANVVPPGPAAHGADQEQHAERDREQEHRHGGRRPGRAALDL